MQGVVGADWVFTSAEDLEPYRDPYSLRWGDADEYLASGAVAPDSAEQVAAIVKIANKYKIPLYPISTGKNFTYGGAAPTFTGSVVVDLKRMNRILKVDDKRNFALVEPGVAYFDLYRHIQEHQLKVWIDCPDPGWGSLIGNALDHGVGYTSTAFRDHFGSHCGMEVVTPTGEIMRTGMGALPGADSWQDYRYGVGPFVDGLFGQGNFGIVTKMGFWLFPQPEGWLTGTISVPNYADFEALVEEVNYLEDSQLMTGQTNYSSPLNTPGADLAALMANGWPGDAAIEAYAKQRGGPAWRARLQFYGPEKSVRANWEYALERIRRRIPGATASNEEYLAVPLTPEQERTHHQVNFGIPNMQIYNSIARRESDGPDGTPDGHVDFFFVVPRTAAAVHRAQQAVYEARKATGFPTQITPFGGPLFWHQRTFIVGGPTVPNYRDNPDKNRKSRELFEAYIKYAAAEGFGEYRTNPAMQDLLVGEFSFGDHALLRYQERLKDGVDPNGIIAPGRYGVWPKHLRESLGKGTARAKGAGKGADKGKEKGK
jgi:4-cresol dehydrogenase (hydroxylating)